MERRIIDYCKMIDQMLADGTEMDWTEAKREHLVQISFFQHERLIHLIVTVTFALLEMISTVIVLLTDNLAMIILSILLLGLLLPYIRHYYRLEDEVQKMYRQYDRMTEKQKEQ